MSPQGPRPVTGDAPIIVVDARGLRCPRPVIELARVARTAAPGTVLELLATDPAAGPDVAAWCRMRGHLLLTETSEPAEDGHHSPVRRLRLRL